MAGLGHRRAADRDHAAIDQALDLGPGQLRIARRHEHVEPRTGVGVGRDKAAATGRDSLPDWLPRIVVLFVVGYQIFDLTWPLDFTSTSTIARS